MIVPPYKSCVIFSSFNMHYVVKICFQITNIYLKSVSLSSNEVVPNKVPLYYLDFHLVCSVRLRRTVSINHGVASLYQDARGQYFLFQLYHYQDDTVELLASQPFLHPASDHSIHLNRDKVLTSNPVV